MPRSTNLAILSTLWLALSACASGPSDSAGSQGGERPKKNSAALFHGHMMPIEGRGPVAASNSNGAASGGAQLVYNGGPVLSAVKVWTVYWTPGVANQSSLNQFFSVITSSAYFDWLVEYNTPTQTIGHGSFGGAVVDTGAPGGTLVDDGQIQTELGRLIDAGQLPPNDGNNLYMVYFPPGVNITNAGSQSCVQFCAYHGSFTHAGSDAYYGVLPDLGGACAGGCGGGSLLQNTTSVSSHEMIEAVTDAAVASGNLAWYDQTNGEIGDICNAEQGTVAGWTIQLEWSNQANGCVATGTGNGMGSGAASGGGTGSGAGLSSGSGSGSGGGGFGSGGSGAGGSGAGGSGFGGAGAGGSGGGDPCNGISSAGECDGNAVVWCDGTTIWSTDCSASGLSCGYDAQNGVYGCF